MPCIHKCNPNCSLTQRVFIMPKNPHKRRINPGKVTHVTCITKDTSRGPSTRIVRLDPLECRKSKSGMPQSSPMKATPSTSRVSFDQIQPNSDDSYLEIGEIRPLRLPTTKVSPLFRSDLFSKKSTTVDSVITHTSWWTSRAMGFGRVWVTLYVLYIV